MQITLADAADAPRLFEVWQASVRATHDFLDAAAIDALVPIVRDLLHSFKPIHCVRDDDGLPYALMGTADGMLEMLFVDPARRGQGAGRLLTRYAIDRLGVTRVDVNEDNRQALGFYERLGFRQVGRSARDGFGNPYPILHLRLDRGNLLDGVSIRPFAPGDEPALVAIFLSSVHGLAAHDYSAEQLEAWAPSAPHPELRAQWEERIRANQPWVAVLNGCPAGFADLQESGHIDQFFVAAGAAGRGVGAALMRHLHAVARERGIATLGADVSLTAQPFFARFGFVVERERLPVVRGVALRNAHMRKALG